MNSAATFPTPLQTVAPPARGLAALREVNLPASIESQLERVRAASGGPTPWRARKAAELRDLFALEAISGRLRMEWFDASTDLRCVVLMRAPVPVRGSAPDAPLVIAPFARLGLTYRREVLMLPQPGFSFVQILAPQGVFLPNASEGAQVLCLGTQLPIGIPIREVVLIAYGALTLRTVQFSLSDPGGVLNRAAAIWWQRNVHRIPLSHDPFIVQPPATP